MGGWPDEYAREYGLTAQDLLARLLPSSSTLKRRESLDESVVSERMREAADQVRRYLEDENLRRRHLPVGHVDRAVVFHGWEMAACVAVDDGPSTDDHGRTTKRGRS